MKQEKYSATGKEKSAAVHQLFGAIARRYDLINDIQSFGFHRWWKKQLVKTCNARPGSQVLDVCTGTGDVAFALKAAGATVVGFDFSAPMLQVAVRRAKAQVDFVQGDALRMPFENGSFDCVTISYGLRNLAGVEEGLREILRVLKPGGTVAILDFGKPTNKAWRSVYFFYLRFAVPLFGKLFCGNSKAYAYILDSLIYYPAQEGVHRSLLGLNCQNCRIDNYFGGVMSINYAEKEIIA